MKLGVYSLYWDNVDDAIVRAQRQVFARLDVNHFQHRIDGMEHGEWVDWVMGRGFDVDAFLFLDIDCIPLSLDAVRRSFTQALSGVLFGCHGAANHIDPRRSYAAAWYVCIGRHQWEALGRPSARATPYGDVCQMWTDVWTQHRLPVELVDPTACAIPRWNLPTRENAFGIGTTYGDVSYHLFESRGGDHAHLFIDKCREVLQAP